ncbi:MAG TPA: energy-coupling factor ABC transporter permease [Anaerolineaceae bacterium]|nr:energy-coupling factor ABC transporter permease [Anaerolineaceae bacterium]
MNLPDHLLPPAWTWVGHVLFALVFLWVVRTAPWRRLKDAPLLNLWLGTSVVLMGIWSIKTGIKPGLNFHLLGATAFTLMFGPQLAIAGIGVVLLGVTLAGMSGWTGFSWNALLMGVLPVGVSYAIYRVADRKLPNHLFVYIFLNGFFGAALAIASTGIASTLLLHLAGVYPPGYLYGEYLPFYILIGWSEAVSTGAAVTLMAVYRPGWLSTFDDARYLRSK